MPTVILLDLSYSLSRPINSCCEDVVDIDVITRYQLAILGINSFLDYLSQKSKLEFVSLVVFNSTYQQLVPFTRDYNEIKSTLSSIREWGKTFLDVGLEGAQKVLAQDWGFLTASQIILVTDGREGFSQNSLYWLAKKLSDPTIKSLFPFQFQNKLLIGCLSCESSEASHNFTCSVYTQLIKKGGFLSGELFTPDKVISAVSVRDMFIEMAKKHYVPFTTILQCGHLSSSVSLFPPPHNSSIVDKKIVICGFLDGPDASSPPYLSRHLVLPVPGESSDKESIEKTATFTVLLHGSLKVEGMTAIVQLSKEWFGMLYSHADSKKKSNLTLSVFPHGSDSVPWLGNMSKLGFLQEQDAFSYLNGKSPFPVVSSDKKSYSQNCVVWIHNTGLQADIQKILRNARKLPEKQAQFYKELNRLRKAALSIGFLELFESLASLLDRECATMANNTHPGAALQMTHAASFLRNSHVFDINQAIIPLPTNFSNE